MNNTNNKQTEETLLTSGMVTRWDYFAAHALQGLLASGQFTEEQIVGERECGSMWVKVEKTVDREPGEPSCYIPALELARFIADRMIK